MKKKQLVLIKQKTEFIPSSEIKCPKFGFSNNNYWAGWVGQSNFEWSSIVYTVHSFSSFRLDYPFFRCCRNRPICF